MTETVEAKQLPLRFPMTAREAELFVSVAPYNTRRDDIVLCIAALGVEATRFLEWDEVAELADWLNKALERRP